TAANAIGWEKRHWRGRGRRRGRERGFVGGGRKGWLRGRQGFCLLNNSTANDGELGPAKGGESAEAWSSCNEIAEVVCAVCYKGKRSAETSIQLFSKCIHYRTRVLQKKTSSNPQPYLLLERC